ncbi:DMT family transporter [Vibrio viridaestus]|uniref:DMT family transporter n=1 Tax=Vibrio viridaestus TaxID=2487322 RepID=A0A3N9TJW3_9VIBR|nr:DMT family transporter [Vibrio viridaestus]RQW64254.1 DMT family transporter [Vibrio viridaestus]
MTSASNTKAVMLLILCAFFWGSCFPVGKDVLGQVHAYTLVFWRFVIAAICLMLYIRIKNIQFGEISTNRWGWVILVSIVGVGGLNLGLFTGLTLTSSTNGALIMALSPLVTSLIACFFQLRLPSTSQVFSIVVSLIGVGLVITNGQIDMLASLKINHGDKLIFCGMLAWSAYTYCSQSISRWMPVIPYTLIGMLSGAVVIGGLCLFEPDVHPLSELLTTSRTGISEVIYIGVFGTVAGYLLWLNGVQALGAPVASLFFNFVPVFSVLTSVLMGQTVTTVQILGISVVIIGLLIPRMPALAGQLTKRVA